MLQEAIREVKQATQAAAAPIGKATVPVGAAVPQGVPLPGLSSGFSARDWLMQRSGTHTGAPWLPAAPLSLLPPAACWLHLPLSLLDCFAAHAPVAAAVEASGASQPGTPGAPGTPIKSLGGSTSGPPPALSSVSQISLGALERGLNKTNTRTLSTEVIGPSMAQVCALQQHAARLVPDGSPCPRERRNAAGSRVLSV